MKYLKYIKNHIIDFFNDYLFGDSTLKWLIGWWIIIIVTISFVKLITITITTIRNVVSADVFVIFLFFIVITVVLLIFRWFITDNTTYD